MWSKFQLRFNVNGVIITGTMIGMKPYYDTIAVKLIEGIRSPSEEINIAVKKDLESKHCI